MKRKVSEFQISSVGTFDIIPNCALDVVFQIFDIFYCLKSVLKKRTVSKSWKRTIDAWIMRRNFCIKVKLVPPLKESLSLFRTINPKKITISLDLSDWEYMKLDTSMFDSVEELRLEKPALWSGNSRIVNMLLTNLTNLKSLDVSNSRCYTSIPIDHRFVINHGISQLTKLTELIGVDLQSVPSSFVQLRSLDFFFKPGNFQRLNQFTNLETIAIRSPIENANLFSKLTKLTKLSTHNPSSLGSDDGPQSYHSNLKSLSICINESGKNGFDCQDLLKFTGLEQLEIDASPVYLSGLRFYTLTNLKSLEIQCKFVTKDLNGLHLNDVLNLTNLESLHIESHSDSHRRRGILKMLSACLPKLKDSYII